MTAKDIPGGTSADVYYGYDLRGLQTEARFTSIAGSGITNGWDGFGGQKSSSTNMSGTAWTLSYQSDADCNRTRVQHPDANTFTYSYDGLNRLDGIAENGSTAIAALTYNPRGLIASQARGGVTTSYAYTKSSQLTSLSDNLAGSSNDVATGFGYNPANQITLRTRDNDSYAFGSYATASKAYTANGLNQYTAIAGVSPTYDANGNLTSDGTTSYTYDVENRLVTASGGKTLAYDPLGRLYETVGATTMRFLYDGDEMVGEYNSAGTLQRRYVHGRGDDDPVIWYEGSNLATRRSLQSDHQGSIVSVADSSGAAVQLNAYDEYGNPGSSNLGRFQYTGQAWLSDLGMYHYKARIYDPKTGRFLQVDPIGYKDQINLYAYVGNDPFNRLDPTGKYGKGSGWENHKGEWQAFDRAQKNAADDMERTANKLEQRAQSISETDPSKAESLMKRAEALRGGVTALRSDGSDGYKANYVSKGDWKGSEKAVAINMPGSKMMQVHGSHPLWKDTSPSMMIKFSIGHDLYMRLAMNT